MPYSDENNTDEQAAELGKGASGTTYQMRHNIDRLLYAVKMISLKDFENSGGDKKKLQREAELLAKLNHPHIVRYFTSGEMRNNTRGSVFAIFMELLDGGSFGKRVRTKPAEATIAKWIEQVASGLACMHSLKMQHRDLKPDNVLFDAHDRPKIIDLSLSCTLASRARLSNMSVVGTNLYI